ncbi:Pseudouridylate synthase, partial [Thalictrum thalictroides]
MSMDINKKKQSTLDKNNPYKQGIKKISYNKNAKWLYYVGASFNVVRPSSFKDMIHAMGDYRRDGVSETTGGGMRTGTNTKSYPLEVDEGVEPCRYSRNVSQTRWIIDDERKGEASVEEIIGNTVLPLSQGDSYKFHAAGREDIDVRMLGSGRPFLLEVQNARRDPLKVSTGEIEGKINNSEVKLVRVRNVKVVGIEGWNLMREGEAEKQKQYAALVWISRSLEDEDLKTIASVKDMQISQRTPVRVLHRRSPLDRERSIHWMKIERIVGSSQYFLLHLCTQ